MTFHDADLRAFLALYGGGQGSFAPLMIAATLIGGGWGLLALLPMVWHGSTRRFASWMALAIALQAALVWAIKALVGRVRPWIALGLAPPIDAPHDGSFPSGHAAGCFCVVGFLAVVLPSVWPCDRGRARALSAFAGALAVLVAVSRVYLGAHFVSDVVGGAALGAGVGAAAGIAFAKGPGASTKRRRALAVVGSKPGVEALTKRR